MREDSIRDEVGLTSQLYRRWRELGRLNDKKHAIAIEWYAQGEYGEEHLSTWSYLEFCKEIELSAGFVTALGLKRGDVLGFQVPRSEAWLPLFLGALSQGVTVLLLNDSYTAHELGYYLVDAQATIALIPKDHHALLKERLKALGSEEVSLIDSLNLEPHRRAYVSRAGLDDISADDLAVLAYTSGTTGRPKGARIRHRDLMGTLRALHKAWAWTSDDHLIHTLPLFHIHGLFVAALGALWAGASLTLLPRFDALKSLQAVDSRQATILMGVPTHHQRYLQIPADQRPNVSSLRLVTSGSAPLSADRFEAFKEAFGVEIVERYGMTEVGIVLSAHLDGPKAPGSVGYPLPGVSAKICDSVGGVLSQGEVGELHISSESLFAGYHERPEATAQAVYFDGEGIRWMKTGDIAYQDERGMYWLKGRASEMIISGGLNVYPREVETAIYEASDHLALRETASPRWLDEVVIVGLTDPDWGERVEAFYTSISGEEPSESILKALTVELAGLLAPYKRPKQWTWVESLPRNAMGKLQRFKLRDLRA